MESSSTKWGQPSTPSAETVSELLCEVDLAALRVEVEIEDVLKSELPLPVRGVLNHTLGQAQRWRQDAWSQVRALEEAEIMAEIIADGVDPNDRVAVDGWFAKQGKGKSQQTARQDGDQNNV